MTVCGVSSGTDMGISVRQEGEVRIIELTGEFAVGGGGLARPLDLRGSPLLDLSETLGVLLEQGCQRILLDLRKVTFLDSAGLGELVACQKRTRQNGGDIRLLQPTDRVREVLEMTGLTSAFRIFEDKPRALASFDE